MAESVAERVRRVLVAREERIGSAAHVEERVGRQRRLRGRPGTREERAVRVWELREAEKSGQARLPLEGAE